MTSSPGPATEAWGKTPLIHGRVRTMSPASAVHGKIQSRLSALPDTAAPIGLFVMIEVAVRPRIGAELNILVPDLLGTNEPLGRGRQTADHSVLVIDIASPGHQDTTRENMMACATLPSVQELMVVHSMRVLAEVLTRGTDGS